MFTYIQYPPVFPKLLFPTRRLVVSDIHICRTAMEARNTRYVHGPPAQYSNSMSQLLTHRYMGVCQYMWFELVRKMEVT